MTGQHQCLVCQIILYKSFNLFEFSQLVKQMSSGNTDLGLSPASVQSHTMGPLLNLNVLYRK